LAVTGVTASPIWFGPADRPLFGMLHRPDGDTARAGVVLCPPLGREDLAVHSAYRVLAERLADDGIAVLRFDYDGTGDSAGSQSDPGRVAAWSASMTAAVNLVRSTGAPVVVTVGMRMGATLAAIDAVRDPVDALVLWDPCRTGRSFLRELSALHALSVGEDEPEDGSVQTPGFRFGVDTVADLSSLDIAKTVGPMAKSILLLRRPERGHDARLEARLKDGGDLEFEHALGQQQLLSVDGRVNADVETSLARIVAWVSSVAATDPVALDLSGVDASGSPVPVAVAVGTTPILEHAVRIGPVNLFGIVTEAGGGARHAGTPTVVCFNTGKSRHIGPSRLWVELARRWAAKGIRTIRVDLSGLGESGAHPGQARDVFYPSEAPTDIEAVARFVSPDDPSGVVLVGLCSGGYHAVLGGLALGARGVCAFNPVFTRRPIPPEVFGDAVIRHPLRTVPSRGRVTGLVRGHLSGVAEALPERAWWVLHRMGVSWSPVDYLVSLVNTGSNVLVVAGAAEAALLRRGAARTLQRLTRSDRLRFDIIEDLHHAMFGSDDLRRVAEIVYRHVVDNFAA
jgi:dienelactone hydrolase